MKSSKYLLAAGALLALVASPALAYEAGTWVLRAGVGVVAPDSDNFVDDDGVETTTVTVDDGSGALSVVLAESFNGGVWSSFDIDVVAGTTVTVVASNDSGPNAVISALTLG